MFLMKKIRRMIQRNLHAIRLLIELDQDTSSRHQKEKRLLDMALRDCIGVLILHMTRIMKMGIHMNIQSFSLVNRTYSLPSQNDLMPVTKY
ncbi:MAG: hypothetical protein DBY37_04335 [Desulfovibrionaceae bacterium]|nr:MAG: hypothetical protein DBY37_04335 [Desulfovibrionaceae bacterium]